MRLPFEELVVPGVFCKAACKVAVFMVRRQEQVSLSISAEAVVADKMTRLLCFDRRGWGGSVDCLFVAED